MAIMFSEANLQKLVEAYQSGMTKVRLSSGDEITYRSLDQMERIIKTAQQQLASSKKPRRFGYAMRVNKGL